jgi:hypothetical protein
MAAGAKYPNVIFFAASSRPIWNDVVSFQTLISRQLSFLRQAHFTKAVSKLLNKFFVFFWTLVFRLIAIGLSHPSPEGTTAWAQ